MKKINFELLKNSKLIISEKNISCIDNDKLIFMIENDKYTIFNDTLIRKTNEEEIVLDFKNNNCKVYINGYNGYIEIKLDVIEYKKLDNIITIKYKIETEENVINTIKIEYI